MNNNTRAHPAIFAAAVLACAAATASAQPGRPTAPGTQPPPPILNEGPQPPICDVVVKVKTTDPEQRGHLKVNQWLRLIGPIAPQGHMVVLPVEKNGTPKHSWRPGLHIALRSGDPEQSTPWILFLKVPVLDEDAHPTVENHQYIMTINTLQQGCPRSVRFDTLPHEYEIIDDHPGHANAD